MTRGEIHTCIARRDSMVPMTSSPMPLTDKKAEPVRPPTSPAGHADAARAGEDGFTLLELVCVIAIIAILAAIVVPAIPRGTSRTVLESYAIETAALLQAD